MAGTPQAPPGRWPGAGSPHDLSLHLELKYGVSVGLLHFQGGNAAGWRHRIVEAGPGASSGRLLRGGLLRDRVAHLYAGCGIVRDSDPAAELAETEIKLQTMLPLLA